MDEVSSILKFCERNMENMIRKCVTKTFDGYIDDYTKQLQDLERENKNKKHSYKVKHANTQKIRIPRY